MNKLLVSRLRSSLFVITLGLTAAACVPMSGDSDGGPLSEAGPEDSKTTDSGPGPDSGPTDSGPGPDSGPEDSGPARTDGGTLTPDEACDAFFAQAHETVNEIESTYAECTETSDCALVEDMVLSCEEQNTEVSFCPFAVSAESAADFQAATEEAFESLCEEAPPDCISAATCAILTLQCEDNACVGLP